MDGRDRTLTLYGVASQGFRPPQATELYRLQSGQNVADLDSEEVTAFEVGGRGSLGVVRLFDRVVQRSAART